MSNIGRLVVAAGLGIAIAASATPSFAQDAGMKKWTQGKG